MLELCWNGKQGIGGGGGPESIPRLAIASLLIGASMLVLAVPAANAQSDAQTVAQPGVEAPGRYLVTFGLDQTTLTDEDRRVIAEAAEDYRQGGAPQISVTGYADTSGSADYNLELSQRRAEIVAEQLVLEGVPATDIVTAGQGEGLLLVPTADGVAEPRNRRVEIVVPQAAAPVVAAPAPPAAPVEEVEEEPSHIFTIGPIYGHNFGETDDSKQNDLVGAELTYSALPGFLGGLSLKQGLLYSLNGENDDFNGRSIISLDFAPDLGIFRPFLAANFGGVYGSGFQDGLVAGPEIGFNIALVEGLAMRAKAAYDYQFRNPGGFDEGIAWVGLGFGIGF